MAAPANVLPLASALFGVAGRAVLHARSKIPHTWNRSSDFARMVTEKKAPNLDEAKRMLQDDYDKRRKVVKDSVEPKLQQVTKPGTGYTPWNFLAEKEPPELLDGDDKIMYAGMLAEQHLIGNCGEMAAVAYRWLRQQGVAGVHYVNMRCAELAYHTFVLIGAGSSVHEGQCIDHTLDLAKSRFGNDAIICDPWLGGGKVFVVDHWMQAVKQMIEEAVPEGKESAKIDFKVLAKSSTLTREQKVALWKAKPH